MFDVRLNGHMVVKDLDIFDRVGHSTAHDEIVPFSIRRGKLSVQGEVSTFNGKLTVEFVKVTRLSADVSDRIFFGLYVNLDRTLSSAGVFVVLANLRPRHTFVCFLTVIRSVGEEVLFVGGPSD